MRKLVNLLKNRWVLRIIGILALSALVWFGADFVKFGANNTTLSVTGRLIIIGFILLNVVIWSLIRWGLDQRKNNQMMEGLEEVEDGVNEADLEQNQSAEEVELIGGRFKDALAVLKKSKFKSSSGSKTLYQLPWYIIIGPPGAGKTTALVNSGLDFPLAETHGSGALGGVGGTRNCDWWFTNEAVLIDTAGRYTTQDSQKNVDNKAWLGFLKLLKRHRPRRPVNGVLVAISLHELMVQSDEQRLRHAQTIRSRIDEIQDQLGISIPIYLMFTKGDLVAGFSEFFANLSQAERAQVWGMTFPFQDERENPVELFVQQFSLLMQRLNQRVLWRVDSERNTQARALIQGFPNRMEALLDNLRDFIGITFSANQYTASPLLRGVYFSSATQEGSPIDRMMSAVSASFGLQQTSNEVQAGTGKSFFLQRLMKDVVFAEANLAGMNRKIENLLRWGRRLSFVLLAVVSVGLVLTWAGSLTQNKSYMTDVKTAIDEYEQAARDYRPNPRNIAPTLAVLEPLGVASGTYDQNLHPWLSGFGLYDGRVDTAAKSLYQSRLTEYFLPALRSSMVRELNRLTPEDPALPDTLGVYLMMSDKSHQDDSVILSWAENHWQRQFKGNSLQQQQLAGHLQALLSQPLPDSEPDPRELNRARQKLSRIPVSKRLYNEMQTSWSVPVDMYQQIGGESELVFGVEPEDDLFNMPRLYTKPGFDDADFSVDSSLINDLDADSWIYGSAEQAQYGQAEREELSRQIERAYLADYTRHWRSFLQKLSVVSFPDLTTAVESLSHLSDPTYSPLLLVLQAATENTELRPPLLKDASESAIGGVIPDSMKPTSVDKDFRELHRLTKEASKGPAPVSNAIAAVESLHEMMGGIEAEGLSGEASYRVVKERFLKDGNNAIQKLRKLAVRTPEPMRRWMEEIADHSWKVLLSESGRYLSDEWNSQVYAAYQQVLENRYPLDPASEYETPLAEFSGFIGPDGTESTFFNEYLKPFVDTRNWQPVTVDGRKLNISNMLLKQLQQARNLRSAYYNSSKQMSFRFRIKPQKLDPGVRKFTIIFGNQNVRYSHGPKLESDVSWTSGEDDRIQLLFEDLNGSTNRELFSGDWALHRLLDASKLSRGSNRSNFVVTFNVGSRKAEYQIAAKTAVHPLDISILRNLKLPPRL